MASWNDPNNSNPNHVNVLSDLGDKDTYSLTMGQAGGPFTDRPEGEMLWDNGAKLFKRLTATIETVQLLSLAGGGTGASTAAGARTVLDVKSTGELDAAYVRQDADGADIDDIPAFRNTIDVYAKGDVYTQADVYAKSETYTKSEVDAKTIINNTLTSTSTTESLSAAQGKVLKDQVDLIPVINSQQAELSASGSLTGGTCVVYKIGNSVTVHGNFTYASSDFVLVSGFIPSWARPTTYSALNSYSATEGRDVSVTTGGNLSFSSTDPKTSSNNFTITYISDL